jgi:hypothetical protein
MLRASVAFAREAFVNMGQTREISGLKLPGDDVIGDASMVFDHAAVYVASPEVSRLGGDRG